MAYIDCENCYHGEVCTYRRASHDKIVLCEHWQPTADVVEVKRGKWEINCDGYYPYCSNCMTEPKSGVMSKYCPECGADMRGDK